MDALHDPARRRVKHLALVEVYRPRFGKDPVDGVRFHGVSVSFAKDSSVGLGAAKKAFKSLSVLRSTLALSLEEATCPNLSKASPK